MERFAGRVEAEARTIVDGLAPSGRAEVRRDLAGPLAVRVVAAALDLVDVEPGVVLGWYDEIVGAVDRVSAGGEIGEHAPRRSGARPSRRGHRRARGRRARAGRIDAGTDGDRLERRGDDVRRDRDQRGHDDLPVLARAHAPEAIEGVATDRSLLTNAVEESLRLEPAAGRVDRYATEDVALGGAAIRRGDLVIVSLTAANRDPAVYEDPDHFDVRARTLAAHLAFAQGPHACVGLHLARLETEAALSRPRSTPGPVCGSMTAPRHRRVVFRKPRSLPVVWDA